MSDAQAAGFEIDGREVRDGGRTFLIAEVAQAHDGSLGLAHSFIDAAAAAGADAIKFQTHIADAESTPGEPFRVKFSYVDATRFDYWRRMEFSPEQWAGLAAHARERGLVFLSTPFSLQAVELLERLAMPAWKIGSGEVTNRLLLERCAGSGRPVLLSSGMSTWAELDEAVALIRGRGAPAAVLQCTSEYPTPLSRVGVNLLQAYRLRYGVPVGLSDHSATVHPSLYALAHGAALIEVHVAFDRAMFGPDSRASLTFAEFASLAAARDAFGELSRNAVDKDAAAKSLETMRGLFSKSLALRRSLPAGAALAAADLTAKKPGTGIPTSRLHEIVGRRLRRDVPDDRLLDWDDLAAEG